MWRLLRAFERRRLPLTVFGVAMALQGSEAKPDRAITVFAGADIDATEVVLMLAPETNGHVAVKSWQALSKITGREHAHLALHRHCVLARTHQIAHRLIAHIGHVDRLKLARVGQAREVEAVATIGLDSIASAARRRDRPSGPEGGIDGAGRRPGGRRPGGRVRNRQRRLGH